MGFVSDIADLVRKGPELAGKINSVKFNTKTIAKGAKDSTFQFPCIVVDTIPIDMANTCARTLDQVYATFTQTWLSMNSMFDITIDPTPLTYLRSIHQNLNLESLNDLVVKDEDIVDYMEKVYDGSYKLFMDETKTNGILFNVSDHITREMMESHKDLLNEYLSDYNLSPVEIVREDSFDVSDMAASLVQNEINKSTHQKNMDNLKATEKNRAPQISSQELKRANDIMPYGIQVRLIAVNDKKEFVQYVDFIVGVKTILHTVSSMDMIENLARALQNRSILFKFLRWTTGEISFVKDFLLNLNDIKADAVNRKSGKSPFFGSLKRMKNKKLTFRNFTVPTAIIPNSTFIITSYEADYLKDNFAIDVRNESVALKLMDKLFLMAFIILDEGTETISILYDGDRSYQTYSLESLEKSNDMNSNKLGREIGRMISR